MEGPVKRTAQTVQPKRGQANRRERVRTENVNAGFDRLRNLVPTDPKDRKLSKIEVLRLATSYISHLYNLTKADSCFDARNVFQKGDKVLQQGNSSQSNKNNPTSTRHICTFCIMRRVKKCRKE